MTVNTGFEDLKCKEILGFSSAGLAQVMMDGTLASFKLFIEPNGNVKAKQVIRDATPDQVGGLPRRVPVAERWANTDQIGAA